MARKKKESNVETKPGKAARVLRRYVPISRSPELPLSPSAMPTRLPIPDRVGDVLSLTGPEIVKPSDAFKAAVEANWTCVYRFLYTLSGNPCDTEDLTQETFLRALRRWETFREGTNLRAWLLRIGTNAFFDIQRKKKTVTIAPLGEDVAAQGKSVEQTQEDREQGDLILAALQDLV